MPLPTFAKQEEIPEAFRSEYEERDGVWHPKATGELEVERKKRAELLDEKKKEEKRRQDVERERDELKRSADAKAAGISEEELQKIRDAEAAARKPIEDELAQAKAENRKLRLTDRVQALALKFGVLPDRIEDAMQLLEKRTDLTDANGIVVKDKNGAVTTEKIEDFLQKTFKAEKPWLYAGSGGAGSGSPGPGGGGDPPPAPDKEAQEARRQQVRAAF